MKYFILVLALLFTNSFAATKMEKYLAKEEKKYTKLCHKKYTKGKDKMKDIKQENAYYSILLFECFKEHANALKPFYPRGEDVELRNLIEDKINQYNMSIAKIESKFDVQSQNVKGDVGEIITEKVIIIKKENQPVINSEVIINKKATTKSEAVGQCQNRGFKQKSSDPLEVYLFNECIKELGFGNNNLANPTPVQAKQSQSLKIESQSIKKESKQKKSTSQEKPAKSSVLQKQEPETNILQANPIEKDIITPEAIKPAPAQEPTKPALIKKEVAPKENPKQNNTSCKVDAYGNRICLFQPKVAK